MKTKLCLQCFTVVKKDFYGKARSKINIGKNSAEAGCKKQRKVTKLKVFHF